MPLRLEVEAHGCYEAAADCGNECNWYLWIDNREVAASPSPEPCPGDTVYEGELERGQFFELGLHIEHAPHEQRARLSAYLDGELCRTVVAEGYNIGGTVLRGELRNGEARCWGPDDEEQ